jgi:uncharacterized membrane protein
MLILLIIAIIATPAFYQRSREIGAPSGKIASVPFVALGILLAVGHVVGLFGTWITSTIGASSTLANGLRWMLSIFILLSYTLVIRAFWIALNFDRSKMQ